MVLLFKDLYYLIHEPEFEDEFQAPYFIGGFGFCKTKSFLNYDIANYIDNSWYRYFEESSIKEFSSLLMLRLSIRKGVNEEDYLRLKSLKDFKFHFRESDIRKYQYSSNYKEAIASALAYPGKYKKVYDKKCRVLNSKRYRFFLKRRCPKFESYDLYDLMTKYFDINWAYPESIAEKFFYFGKNIKVEDLYMFRYLLYKSSLKLIDISSVPKESEIIEFIEKSGLISDTLNVGAYVSTRVENTLVLDDYKSIIPTYIQIHDIVSRVKREIIEIKRDIVHQYYISYIKDIVYKNLQYLKKKEYLVIFDEGPLIIKDPHANVISKRVLGYEKDESLRPEVSKKFKRSDSR